MVLPESWFDPAPLEMTQQINYQEMVLSPQEALLRLRSIYGEQTQASDLFLKKIEGKLYFAFILQDGSFHLVDASTGEEFFVTEQSAEQLVRIITRDEASQVEITPLIRHDLLYPFGPLPVFRVKFQDSRGALYHVNMSNSDVTRMTSAIWIKAVISSFHTFEPMKLLTQRESVRLFLLVSSAVIAVFVSITGYVLAIQPLLRRRMNIKRVKKSTE